MASGLPKIVSTKLVTSPPAEPFMKWGLDFMKLVIKTRYTDNGYILVAIDYITKFVKTRALWGSIVKETAHFLYEAILTWFVCLRHLISDQDGHFISAIHTLTENFLLHHMTSKTYYSQENDQTESINKIIVWIL